MTLWKKASAPVLLLGLATPLLADCDLMSKVPGLPDCSALKDGNLEALKLEGDANVQAQLKSFLGSVYQLHVLTVDIEKDLIGACGELGKAIQMDEASLKADAGSGDGAKKVCGEVSEKVKALLASAGGATLTLSIGEPRCEIDIDAMGKCLEGCSSVKVADLVASCEPAKLSGKCEGECKGSCLVEMPQCAGACMGVCDGTCDGKKFSGSCAGKCAGKCSGSCGIVKPKCDGICAGTCGGKLELPKCAGELKPPTADPNCLMTCGAKMSSQIVCSAPAVKVTIVGKSKVDLSGLQKGIEAALPRIINIGVGRVGAIKGTVMGLVESGQKLPSIATSVGLQGAACITQGAVLAGTAAGSIKVVADVSVEVKSRVTGSGG